MLMFRHSRSPLAAIETVVPVTATLGAVTTTDYRP
jgi:hypothetical protein